ncbi:MAG: translational GTPase TypA [Holosporales bacterium]|jgi:GTP-binding protein|nr:translational GTPase TypA [Holosporales bacterium]
MLKDIKNLAIIAHVDHGKTTLIDALFKHSGLFRDNQQIETCALDYNDLERERGITILAKCTSFNWNGTKLNIVDTPGHADFGGEVERILSMVDGVLVLVDASEGPMPQTKFVLAKALALNLNPIVVVNKIDKSDTMVSEVLNEVFDLFIALGANDSQLDFPIVYASGRNGWAVRNLESDERKDMVPLLDTIVEYVPNASIIEGESFRMLVTMLEYDQYLGRILTGKILSGTATINDAVHVLRGGVDGGVERSRLTKLLSFEGLKRVPVESAVAGDIVAIAGLEKATVADTIASIDITEPVQAIPIDPPTISITFSVNDSPLAGKEGKSLTSRMIGDRLLKEAEGNVSITVKRSTHEESYEVAGRGELQLGILIETMRREGFELSIGRPKVLFRKCPDTGNILEPIEELYVDLDDEFTGTVIDKLIQRKGEMVDMRPSGVGKTRIKFLIPTRGLIGYYGDFLTDTRGSGIMNRSFHSYAPHKGPIDERARGALVSTDSGKAIAYALFFLKERGTLFVSPGDPVYEGMIIGEHSRENELDVNPTKEKQLSNCRASGKDDNIKLPPPRQMSLEQAIAYIKNDEIVEVTPKSIRLRKRYLDQTIRKRMSRVKDATPAG